MNKIFIVHNHIFQETSLNFQNNQLILNGEYYDFEIINKNQMRIGNDLFYTQDSYLYFSDISYEKYVKKIFFYHYQWFDECILNNITKRLFRISRPDEEGSITYNSDGKIMIQWDKWGYEEFEMINDLECFSVGYKQRISQYKEKNDGKSYIFFHVCCIENWKEIVEDMIHEIRNSGLYDRVEKIYFIVLGELSEYFSSDEKFEIYYHHQNIHLYEIETMNQIKQFCYQNSHENINILYLHTKGVRKAGNHDCTVSWRKMMEYHLINHYEECLEYLSQYDVIGSNLINSYEYDSPEVTVNGKHNYHFSGNFWWSKSSHIMKLSTLEWGSEENRIITRCKAENWICSIYPHMNIGIAYEDITNTHPYHRYVFDQYKRMFFMVKEKFPNL